MPISTVSLYLTESCNLRCRYCFLEKQPRTLSVDIGRQVMDFMLDGPPQVKQVSVFFFGGEPLMAFDTLKELTLYGRRQAKEKDKILKLGLTTNGTLFTDDILDFLFEHEISINLSLDGRPETQDFNRQTADGRGSFALVDGVIDRILERKPCQGVRMTYDTKSVHALHEDHEYLWSRGFTSTAPIAVMEDDWTDELLDIARDQFWRLSGAVLDRMRSGDLRRVGFLGKYIGRLHQQRQRLRSPCGACGGYIGVSVDGTLYPCQRFAAAKACAFGSIWELKDRELRTRFLTFDSRHMKGCHGCSAERDCAGGCPAVNVLCAGDLYTPWPHQCDFIRMEHEAASWLYEQLLEEQNPLLLKLLQSSRQAGRQRQAQPTCEPVVPEVAKPAPGKQSGETYKSAPAGAVITQ